MTQVPDIKLNNGITIPQLGFGVFQIKPADTVEAVTTALKFGYRHIDTAEMYQNEKEVGEAIAAFDVDPAEVFVTSKLSNSKHGFDDALAAFDGTYDAIGKEKLDLFLVHWPLPTIGDFVETWRAMERIYSEGRVRSIGVSNFTIAHLDRLAEETDVVPAINQIEAHPYLTQLDLLAYDTEHGIVTQAWSPIAQGAVLDDPEIVDIAGDHGKTPAQVVLRWHIQLGSVVFPKSVTPARIEENIDLFDFELSEGDMQRITALNRDERIGPDPETFDYLPD
jgi:2,5-diketo-D-gluconate reductase A